ncbi:MAG: hypothetical protein AAF614_36960 [Chloroflexota bacterium]
MSSDKLKPFQSLMDELAEPENRPVAPRLDPTFKQQLRHRLLDHGTTKLSGRAMLTLWKFALTAVFIFILGGSLLFLWLTLSRPPETLAPMIQDAASPTATHAPTETPRPTLVPTVSPMVADAPKPFFWKTTGTFPMSFGGGIVAESLTVDWDSFARGETAVFTVAYSTTEELTGNYNSFVHLFNGAGELVTSVDKPLGHTSSWGIGQSIAETYELFLPDLFDHAPLNLSLGLYDFATGERLLIDGAPDMPIATISADFIIEGTIGRINRDNVELLELFGDGSVSAVLAKGTLVAIAPGDPNDYRYGSAWRLVRVFGTNEQGWIPADALGNADALPESPALSLPLSNCPSTMPPIPSFVPPDPYPKQPPSGFSWFGGDELWTVVPNDQKWRALPLNPSGGLDQKIVWWHKDYNPQVEPKPPLIVSGRRLDGDSDTPPFVFTEATNGFNPESGNFMLMGITLPSAGCWEIMGQYKDKTLSFVVEVIP